MKNIEQPELRPNPKDDYYMLMSDYNITVNNIKIVVPKYFQYDGASIPRVGWQVTYTPFDPDVMLPSLIHDWLFYNHQVPRDIADDIFYRLLKDNGVSGLKANIMWGAVRTAGSLFWDNDDDDIKDLANLYLKVKESPNLPFYKFPKTAIYSADRII